MLFTKEIETKLPLNEKGEIKQNDRNALKTRLTSDLLAHLTEVGLDVALVKDGVAVQVANEELGSVPIVVSITMKPMTFDIVEESRLHAEEVAEKEKVKAEKAEKAKAKTTKK
jgi:hypothetical protein